MTDTAPSSVITSTQDDQPWFRRLAWPVAGLALLTVAVTATLAVMNRAAMHSFDQADPVDLILPIGVAVIGAMVASRQPRNPIGWIFLGIAIFGAAPGIATQYVFRSFHFGRLPGVAWFAWAHDLSVWVIFPSGLASFLFLLFPDGHLQSHRWRWFARFAGATLAVGFVFMVLNKSAQLQGSPSVRSPLGSLAVIDMNNGAPGLIWMVALIVLLTSMVGMVIRTRRATGQLRQQLRWLAYASVFTGLALVISIVASSIDPRLPNGWWDAVIIAGFGIAVPVSCGIAILKHGLFEVDIVINKAVVYAVVAAFFTVVYLAVVVGIGTAVGSTHNTFLTVVAAAVIAVAFNPVRQRARRFANRLVYGDRASPYEVLSEFSGRMADTYSVEDVLPRMATLLGEGTGATQARVWLRIGSELRPSASWGTVADEPSPLAMANGELPKIPGSTKTVAVRHRDELLGALALTKPPNEPLTAVEDKLVTDLAAQAGLVLRNVGLTEELRANLEELRASRQRLVTAQDGERRRLERNIHDGAQQQLVALSVKARLAESLAGSDPARERDLLKELQTGIQDALEDLRDLARGIYPPLLADKGLVAALEAQSRKTPIQVSIGSEGVGRYPQEAEAAVYFCTLEALQNVAKYADARTTTVRLNGKDGWLEFEISDDGIGFDATAKRYGTGVQGMIDRLAALGGSLEVLSEPGLGTKVTGRLPVRRLEPST
jgi:signal transduction histidine kinase